MRTPWIGWALIATLAGGCHGAPAEPPTSPNTNAGTDTDTDTGTDTDTDTGLGPTAETGGGTTVVGPDWASCVLASDNALRVVCQITDPTREGPAAWTLTQGSRVRTATSEGTEAVVLWGFAPNQQLEWRVEHGGEVGSGAFPTDPLPPGIVSLQATVLSGSPVATEAVAVPYTCDSMAGAAVFDTEGEVIWYQQVPATGQGVLNGVVGLDWANDRVLLSVGGHTLLEYSVEGEEVFQLDDTERPIHHDNAWASPYRFVLNAAQHDASVVDGFYVVDEAGGIVAEWDLADHLEVGTTGIGAFWALEFPFAADWSHANSIEVDGPDHVLISLKHLNAVLRVVSNPSRSDFGAIEWTLDGGRGLLASDFVWTDEGAFFDQHHVARRASGGLTLFDNGSQAHSRALTLDLDEAGGSVSVDDAWAFEQRCAVQGSVYEQADGSILTTCAAEGLVREYPAGAQDPGWEMEVLCIQSTGGSGHLARALPVTLPD